MKENRMGRWKDAKGESTLARTCECSTPQQHIKFHKSACYISNDPQMLWLSPALEHFDNLEYNKWHLMMLTLYIKQ